MDPVTVAMPAAADSRFNDCEETLRAAACAASAHVSNQQTCSPRPTAACLPMRRSALLLAVLLAAASLSPALAGGRGGGGRGWGGGGGGYRFQGGGVSHPMYGEGARPAWNGDRNVNVNRDSWNRNVNNGSWNRNVNVNNNFYNRDYNGWNNNWRGGGYWNNRPWNTGWYGGWGGWGWWGGNAAAWGVAGLATGAAITSLVNAAADQQSTVITVPQTSYQLNFGSVEAVGNYGASFNYSVDGTTLMGAVNCQQGLLNGQVPATSDQAQLLNAVCQVAYGSGS
jgi:hypothetical protein